jgi:predicted HicB family RNase H-like nuclease
VAVTKAQQKANTKYVKNNYDTIITRVEKGKKATLQAHAENKGESLNGFVNRAIDEAVERDTAKGDEAE